MIVNKLKSIIIDVFLDIIWYSYIMNRFIIMSLLLLLTGCKSSLYKESIQDAKDAVQANLRAYQLSPVSDTGVGAGARAFNRAAYCSTVAILRNEKESIPDGGLPCPTQ